MDSNTTLERKMNLEDLNRDELLKKCKTFLTIIQRAKQSKNLLQGEIELLRSKLETKEKEVPSVVEEVIQDLSRQKLSFVSKIEDLELKNNSLQTNINQYEEENKRLASEINKLDSENVAYKRQVDRVVQENEELISHLESLEKQIEELNKIGLEQRNQLLELEEIKNLQRPSEQDIKIQELEKMLSISLEEIKRMKVENIEDKSEKYHKHIVKDTSKLEDTITKLKEKLKFYHSKIIKLANTTKVMRHDKEILLEEFKIYILQVKDWKEKLNVASDELLNLLKNYEDENKNLRKDNQRLKDLNMKCMEQLEAHKTDDEKSKEMEEMDTLKNKNILLLNENEKLKESLNQMSHEKETLFEEMTHDNIQLQDKIKLSYLEGNDALKVLVIEKEQLKVKINELEYKLHELATQNLQGKKNLEECIIHKNEEINLLQGQIQIYKNDIENFRIEKEELNEKIKDLLKSDYSQTQQISKLEENLKNINEELEKSLTTEKQLAAKSSEEMLNLVQEIENLMKNSSKLQEQIESLKEKKQETDAKLVNADIQTDHEFIVNPELEEEILFLKNKNSQLLTEMNEMNQEIKERGENLSKLEAHCEEMKRKIRIYETQANINVTNLTEKEELIKSLQAELIVFKTENVATHVHEEKEQEIIHLKTENEILKEKLNANCDNNNYSESDVMSTSTISRLEEMERLKDLEGSWEEKYNKLRTLAIKLKAKLRDQTIELNKEKLEKQEIEKQLDSSNSSLQTLRTQYNDLCTEFEAIKKKLDEYHEGRMKKEEVSNVEDEIKTLKKDKTEMENWKKQISLKVQVLRKELEEKENIRKDYESKLLKMKFELEAKDQALKLEIESHKQTRNSLQHFTHENKKNTVLSLEMQDYEKSVKDLTLKLEKKNDHIIKLKGQCEVHKETIKILRDQISTLEEKNQQCTTDLENIVTERNVYKKKTKDLEDLLQNKEEELSNILQQLEIIRSQNEEVSTELSNDIAERQKTINILKQEKDSLQLQNLNLQQNVRDFQQKLSLKEDELSTITNDYENYKIRAQSVLRQNQSRDIGLEEKLSGNVFSLLSQIETLNAEIKELRKSKECTQKLHETSLSEQTLLIMKYEESSSQFEEIKCQYDHLLSKYNQTLTEHNETVRSLKVQAETLGQCYRQQLSEQEVRHNREIIELQSKFEKAHSPNEFLLSTLPTMPREEGEGSESIESINNLPIPLEKLLGNEEDQKICAFKKQISEQESKLTHLTELLADTEQDLVKHVQMNKVLKEEIRRHQRAVEREKHAENLEYLKNVVFKFVTLQSGDERCRLIPVLNTILKLSPEEAQKMEMVAKGDPGLKTWSSYLPIWSPTNKS